MRQDKCPRAGGPALASLIAVSIVTLAGAAAAKTVRAPGGAAGVDLLVSCEPGPPAADYRAPTASGVPLNRPYARARGASNGLISLMNKGGARVRRYVVARRRIKALVVVKYDAAIPDEADLIFSPDHLTLVHTTIANAGIFTVSDVYELPYAPAGGVERRSVQADAELSRMLDLGLAAWRRDERRCDLSAVGAPAR